MITPDPDKTAQIDAASAKIRELIAKRPPPCAETRRQAAAVVAASLASAVGGQAAPSPSPAPPPVVERPARTWGKLAGLLVGLWLAGCAPVQIATDSAKAQAAISAADACDESLSPETRLVSAGFVGFCDSQVYVLDGEHLPADLLAEVEAARVKAEAERAGVAPVVSR